MLGYTTSRDGLLQLDPEVLTSVLRKEPIHSVYEVDKTPLGRFIWENILSTFPLECGKLNRLNAKLVKVGNVQSEETKQLLDDTKESLTERKTKKFFGIQTKIEVRTSIRALNKNAYNNAQCNGRSVQCIVDKQVTRESATPIISMVCASQSLSVVANNLQPDRRNLKCGN
ncbi:unnamed protein product [Acanthoscelides obtectus]|uniref:Uncharacterized protein n=1 Tax=Acanthoscelides obtectus TaxID=200917 RepID=A0A9P0LVJ1_ACAOB|nr:unnamed protein product [Acanthoscelides obtectus]CAK1620778.1 hypothetical protein AOBTE_LOCUS564 [Acanthoscelides obtectus]